MIDNVYPSCPRCESFAVGKTRPLYLAAIGISLTGLGAWLFSVPILGPVFVVSGISLLLLTPFIRGLYYCKDCRKLWKYRKAAPRGKQTILHFPGKYK